MFSPLSQAPAWERGQLRADPVAAGIPANSLLAFSSSLLLQQFGSPINSCLAEFFLYAEQLIVLGHTVCT